jgi:hypothetical protein
MFNPNDKNYKSFKDFLNKEENNSFHNLSSKNEFNGQNYSYNEGKNEDNENENIFDKSYLGLSPKNSFLFLNTFELPNSISGKTESNSLEFLSKRKRNRDAIVNGDKENSEEKLDNDENKKIGRRLKDEFYENEAKHNKYSEDNIITKLKTAIFKYILNHLNQSLEFTKYKFYPLNVKLSTCLKKDFNVKLLERTIYDIYSKEDSNKNYINGNDSNKKLIKKIYEQKIEKKTINILNMKFIDVLNHIREKDMENFLKKIENKNRGKSNDSFMEDVKFLLLNYERWFRIKKGRNIKKIK